MSQNAMKRLYLMQVGSMPQYQIPIVCHLVQTADGKNILIDSGLPEIMPEGETEFENGQDVRSQPPEWPAGLLSCRPIRVRRSVGRCRLTHGELGVQVRRRGAAHPYVERRSVEHVVAVRRAPVAPRRCGDGEGEGAALTRLERHALEAFQFAH